MRLKVTNLSKSFGNQVVLRQVNLELEKVHTLALIGPSGGGKSTLLRIIAGLERPDEGQISLDDKGIIFREKELMAHRRSIGTVFQAYNLFPHLTALQNITLPLEKVHHYEPAEARQLAGEILERFQLSEHSHKSPLNSPEDSVSGWRLRARFQSNRNCCSSTSRRPPLIL